MIAQNRARAERAVAAARPARARWRRPAVAGAAGALPVAARCRQRQPRYHEDGAMGTESIDARGDPMPKQPPAALLR
jgi:hypothetical protein